MCQYLSLVMRTFLITGLVAALLPSFGADIESSLDLNGTTGSCQLANNTHCKCDALCHQYGDCCSQMLQTPPPPPGNLYSGTYKVRSRLPPSPVWSCADLVSGMHRTKHTGHYIIQQCLPNYSGDASWLWRCEQSNVSHGVQYILPVYTKLGAALYKNIFCAYCNSEKEEEVEFASVRELVCERSALMPQNSSSERESFEIVKNNLIHGLCALQFNLSFELRECYLNLIHTCPENSSVQQREMCESGGNWYINSQNKTYRNPDCCKCHEDICHAQLRGIGRQSNLVLIFDFNQWCGKTCREVLEPSLPSNDSLSDNSTYLNETSPTTQSVFDQSINILVMIGSVMSMLSLIGLIVIYGCIRELHNFGGILTMILGSVLFVMQLMFVVSGWIEGGSRECLVVGILSHYFSLCAFIWMGLFAVDVVKSFYSQTQSSVGGVGRQVCHRVCKFSCVGFGVAFVFVFVCVVMDFVCGEKCVLSVRYGEKLCWFNGMWGGIVFFLIPVGCILLLNVCGCVAAFVYLYRTNRDTRHVRGEKNEASGGRGVLLVFVCVKLTLVFGVLWVIQLLASLFGSSIVTKLSGVLNSFQGLMISAVFVMTKRVKRSVKSQMSKMSMFNRFRSSSLYSTKQSRSTHVNSARVENQELILKSVSP